MICLDRSCRDRFNGVGVRRNRWVEEMFCRGEFHERKERMVMGMADGYGLRTLSRLFPRYIYRHC